MRAFDHPNMTNFVCPICNESTDKPVVLIPIDGTGEGHTYEARQYHLDCIELWESTLESGTVVLHMKVK